MSSLEQLQSDRRSWVEASRKNGFEEGIYRFLTELYPDNAHFIYELLQNAEDAGASEVSFRLEQDGLVFEHDGSRLFKLEDVDSITSIGTSTKLNNETTIGKFGVGFKAVFSYTQTPEIRSGDFHFQIVDMVVPELIPENAAVTAFETRFRFPFDHKTKHPEAAVQEITDGLLGLSPNSLLFLNDIRTLRFALPDGTLRKIIRIDEGDERIRIEQHDGPDVETTNWLRVGGEVEVSEEDTSPRKHWVAAAFQLEQVLSDTPTKAKRKGDKSAGQVWRVSPLSEGQGQVSIYFPASKEVSHLRFHIHAPFASTVARDSVRDTRGNRQLVAGLAAVVADGLPLIRDLGLLDENFLAALPNGADQIGEFYRSFIDVLVHRFDTESLTPMRDGGHAAATDLVSSPLPFYIPLSIEDVRFLMGACDSATQESNEQEFPRWMLSRQDLPARAKEFLDQVSATVFGWHQLRLVIEGLNDRRWPPNPAMTANRRANFEEWMAEKTDARIRNLYRLFSQLPEHYEHVSWPAIPMVRVQGNGRAEMQLPSKAYFAPPSQKLKRRDIVLPNVLTTSDKKDSLEDPRIRAFLSSLGVRDWNETARIKLVLDKYRTRGGEQVGPGAPSAQYFKDLHQILMFHQESAHQDQLIAVVPFLIGIDEHKGLIWCCAKELVLDAPYADTGFAAVASVMDKKILWEGYEESPECPGVLALAVKLGMRARLEIFQVDCEQNTEFDAGWSRGGRSSDYGISQDWWIGYLAAFLRSKSVPLMRQVWLAVISGEPKHRYATFRLNKTAPTHNMSSRLVESLKRIAWVPDRDGGYRRPSDLGPDDLRDDFPLPEGCQLLDAIGFGEQDRLRSQGAQLDLARARALGFTTPERAKKLANLTARLTDEQIEELVRDIDGSQPESDLPGSTVRNRERRAARVLDGDSEAPRKESVLRMRSVKVDDEERERSRTYLRAEYTDDGHMVCQACHKHMPFKVQGTDYFESVECVRDRAGVSYQNRLALCPICAAKYRHARGTSDDDLRDGFASLVVDGETDRVFLAALLAGDSMSLHFTGKHAFDLQTILGVDHD